MNEPAKFRRAGPKSAKDSPRPPAARKPVPPEATRWKPGQSGNPSGRVAGTVSLKAALIRYLRDKPGEVDAVAKSLVDAAKEGSVEHIKVLLNRLDGPETQKVEHDLSVHVKRIVLNENPVLAGPRLPLLPMGEHEDGDGGGGG